MPSNLKVFLKKNSTLWVRYLIHAWTFQVNSMQECYQCLAGWNISPKLTYITGLSYNGALLYLVCKLSLQMEEKMPTI